MVKLQKLITDLTAELTDYVPNPRLEVEILTSFALKKDKLWLVLHREDEISTEDANYITKLCNMRKSGMPSAYITGTKEFMSLEFTVNKNVLIPRPETEELVSHIIDSCSHDKHTDILDMCTGSGAICCSLAYYLVNSECTGVDIDANAVETAMVNAHNIGVDDRCEFYQMDVLKKMKFSKKFDVVVSNPPYIETTVIGGLDKTVKDFEPLIALDGGDDGLVFYRAITENIEIYLKNGGMIFFEIGYNQGEAVKNLMKAKFDDIRVIRDMANLDRIVCGRLCI